MAENEIIASCLKELKLPAIKDILEDVITDATEQNWSFRKFLCSLLMREMEQRVENRKYQRIRKAKVQKMLQSHLNTSSRNTTLLYVMRWDM